MKAAKTLAKLIAAAQYQKAGKLMAAAEQLQQAAEEDLELVQELVSNIEELEEPEVAKARQVAKERSRHVAKLVRGVKSRTTAAGELENEEELAGDEDGEDGELTTSALDLARTLASEEETAEDLDGDETAAEDDKEEEVAQDLDGEEADADEDLDSFDVQSAKVAATRRAMAKVARAKSSK
jgi:hypothetical protein